jgi:hypothetical protein
MDVAMTVVARVIRQFHEGHETVTLAKELVDAWSERRLRS